MNIISSILNPLNETSQLSRIEFFVLIMSIFLFIVFVLDAFRFHTRSSAIKVPLLIFETVNQSLLQYTVGLIEAIEDKNELFALWAVLLNTSRSDTDYITAFGVPETGARRAIEIRELILSYLVANINAKLGNRIKGYIWALWSIRPVLIISRIYYYDVALSSYSQGRNSEFVAAYLKNEYEYSKTLKIEPNPTTMKGYQYFVWGENAQEVESKAPDHQFNIHIFEPNKCITIEQIWQDRGQLLSSWDRQNKIKDVCLSYALYKVLRSYTEDIAIEQGWYEKMQKLIFQGLLSSEQEVEAHERVFRVFEIETAFLLDYKRTRYPIIIWYGFPIINFVTFIMTATISILLASKLHITHFSPSITHNIGKINVDRFITYVILIMLVMKEAFEITLYTFSDWTKVRIACKYVEGQWWVRNRLFESIAWFLCTKTLIRRWCKKMPQYNFLQCFNHHPTFKRFLHHASMHMIKRPMDGDKLLKSIKVYEEIKKSIAKALCSMNTTGQTMQTMRSVYRDHIKRDFKWAYYQKHCSQLILVWHIATSLCEIDLFISRKQKQESENSFFIGHIYSWIKNLFSQKPFLVDLKSLEENLRSDYIVANSISRYCAYLLVSAPGLLPDDKIFPRIIFENTVRKARKRLRPRDSLKSIHGQLMQMGKSLEDEYGQEQREMTADVDVVQMGARLGYALITKMEVEERWETLSQFWANCLLYMAPSTLVSEHEERQKRGGEFITLLWALFTHCGIFERNKEEQEAGDTSIADQNLHEMQQPEETTMHRRKTTKINTSSDSILGFSEP